MHNLRALLYYALPADTVISAWIGLCALVAVGTLFLNSRSTKDEQGTAMQWVANLLAIILVASHLHSHDLALLIPANALVLTMAGDFIPIWVLVGLIGLGIFPLLPLMFDHQLPPLLPLLFLVTFIFCVRLKWKS
jgi:hypothetical protein